MTDQTEKEGVKEEAREELIVVGVGASAGGLEALQAFVKNLPETANVAYVVAQHLSPTYKSLMAPLLSKETSHKVIVAEQGVILQPDHIYICPPNKNITIHNDIVYLKEPTPGTYGPKPSIDLFFESLALSKGEKAAGIILSGTGSDGSRGIRAVKAEGGYTIAQDPENAKYDGMPFAAINTGNVDLILFPENMGRELIQILSGRQKTEVEIAEPEDRNVYKNILSKITTVKGIDFSQYKINTIQRRIERRMAALKISNTIHYNNHLQKNPEEIEALFKDILIGVTSFMRDKEGFEALKRELSKYLEKKEDTTLRVWIPGCSTGEEPYSIAMVINEILGADIGKFKIQIFATDIDEEATAMARKGMFPESALLDLDTRIRNKYFVPRKETYELIKPIREMVIFSKHDLNQDPPFLKIDLISCRNLLIYFDSDLQKQVFPMFHYSLNDSGLLFLGKSETVGQFQSHFKTLDKTWKIYSANFLGRKTPPVSQARFNRQPKETREKEPLSTPETPSIPELMLEQVNQHILPTCVVVNEGMDIVYVKGENPYIIFPEGIRTDNIFRNIRPVLSTELRAALHAVQKTEITMVKTAFQKVTLFEEIVRYTRMIIITLPAPQQQRLFMICFQEEEEENIHHLKTSDGDDLSNARIAQMELELARTKEHLQTVIEELETNNEEMQSLNEELQSSNEELQSSNEELETTNEELQSTNEELQTAYTELKATYDEKDERVKEYVRLQEKMERNQERLAIALEASGLGIFDHHIPLQKNDYWSDDFSRVLGNQPGELPMERLLMNDWFKERIHPEDMDDYISKTNGFFEGRVKDLLVRFRVRHKDGNWRWVECLYKAAERDADNRVLRTIGTIRDISEVVNNESD